MEIKTNYTRQSFGKVPGYVKLKKGAFTLREKMNRVEKAKEPYWEFYKNKDYFLSCFNNKKHCLNINKAFKFSEWFTKMDKRSWLYDLVNGR